MKCDRSARLSGLIPPITHRYEESTVQQRYPQCVDGVREGRVPVEMTHDLTQIQPGGVPPSHAESPVDQILTSVSTSSSPPHNGNLCPGESRIQAPLHTPRLTPLIQVRCHPVRRHGLDCPWLRNAANSKWHRLPQRFSVSAASVQGRSVYGCVNKHKL